VATPQTSLEFKKKKETKVKKKKENTWDEEMERNAKYSRWRFLIVLHGFTREH